MKAWQKATLVAVIHVALVSSLGAKLLYDRSTCPRIWVKTQNYDPNLPIRGRYVALSPMFEDPNPPKLAETEKERNEQRVRSFYDYQQGTISVVNGKAVITITLAGQGEDGMRFRRTFDGAGNSYLTTFDPVLYFIPDTAPNPAQLNRGEELWVEVTIPRKGPPRPIQLALKSNETWKPLDVR
jgi:hypothetical protein